MKDFLARIDGLSGQQLKLLAAELNSRLEAEKRSRTEAIAIIGLGCRFPGGANNPTAFWERLLAGFDAIQETPPERWDVDALYDPDPHSPGKLSTRWGGYLTQVDQFDPDFFGIAPREALSMDPQQRLLLEVCWETLENAALSVETLRGSKTGVFVGISGSDYLQHLRDADPSTYDAYFASGNAHSVAAGRLSYIFGWQGPNLAVDTSCSSSLVALHLAVQSLRNRECTMAVAGGVNLLLVPDTTIGLSKANMMAADGRCKSFDARGDGFVRSEGCGLVALKRLPDAVQAGDRILAVIRGSAINQDGRSNGLTAPNGPAQEAVIQAALSNGQVAPHEVSYVEAHGTGTSLGDPIEIQALNATYGQERSDATPLHVGSVKTNLGHLESAAGIAGVIKVVLALQHRHLPPSLHFQTPNPHIAWEEIPIRVVAQGQTWPTGPEKAVAAVSSFGFSGTNAHVLIEAAPASLPPTAAMERPLHLLALSAKTPEALQALVASYAEHLDAEPSSIVDLCYTANSGRTHFEQRAAFLASTVEQLSEQLTTYKPGQPQAGVFQGQAASKQPPKIAFLFTGQGSHYAEMGRQLYDSQPVFRRAIKQCDEIGRSTFNYSLLDILYPQHGAPSRVDEVQYSQVVLFTLQYALSRLWQSWGVTPAVVLGHSAGEYAAACLAGVFSLADALKLVASRGQLMAQSAGVGTMVAVFASEARVKPIIAPFKEQVSIAAVNGPDNVTISGEVAAMKRVVERLTAEKIKTRPLNVPIAAHSPLMEPILTEFETVAHMVAFNAPTVDLVSSMTGQLAQPGEIDGATYWRDHIRQPVRFLEAMRAVQQQGVTLFLEIGPQATLLSLGRRCLPELDDPNAWLVSLRAGQEEWPQLLTSLSQLYIRGVPVNWAGFDEGYARRKVTLPTYPFQRQTYWIDNQLLRSHRRQGLGHPLLQQQIELAFSSDIVFESKLGPRLFPYLEDHRVYDQLIAPSPVYLEMIVAAARLAFNTTTPTIEAFTIHEALILPEDELKTVQIVLQPPQAGRAPFQIFGQTTDLSNGWQRLVEGQIRVQDRPDTPDALCSPPLDFAECQARCPRPVDCDEFYGKLHQIGLQLGPRFQNIVEAWSGEGVALGRMHLHESLIHASAAYQQVHPALLDSCFHLIGTTLTPVDKGANEAYLLLGIDRITFFRPLGSEFWGYVQLKQTATVTPGLETISADIFLLNNEHELLAQLEGVNLKRARPEALVRTGRNELEQWLYKVDWLPTAVASNGKEAAIIGPLSELSIEETVEPLAATERDQLARYEQLMDDLDKRCIPHIFATLHQLGMPLEPGYDFKPAILRKTLGITDPYERLFNRLLAILTKAGLLTNTGHVYKIDHLPDAADLASTWQNLLAAYPDFSPEIKLTQRCVEALPAVLCGQTDPLQLLFPHGSTADLELIYRNSPAAQLYNQMIGAVITQAIKTVPEGEVIRILEVGAGTGSTTSYLLPHLPAGQTDYLFTDLSQQFLANARKKFNDYPFVRYDIFDVEQNPSEQGLASAQFDIVLAANVLHATRDVGQAVTHIRQLLAPKGLFVLFESVRPHLWIDLTFGLTEGWWRFSDVERRTAHPLLTTAQWQTVLQQVGFTAPARVPDYTTDQTIILAEAPPQPMPLALSEESPLGGCLIFGDKGGVGQALSALLRTQQIPHILVSPGDHFEVLAKDHLRLNPNNADEFRQVFAELSRRPEIPPTTVISLLNLDADTVEPPPTSELDELVALSNRTTLDLLQALLNTNLASRPKLWVITQGAQALDDTGSMAVGQLAVWGLGRTIAMEHPELWGGLIDLELGQPAAQLAQTVLAGLQADDNEDQTLWRAGSRYVARLNRFKPEPTLPGPFDGSGTYLITGGLGGLGLKTAQWLVKQGARQLVLVGRRGVTADTKAEVEALRSAGATVIVEQADVAREADMRRVLDRLQAELPPLRGVIHAAGVFDDQVLLRHQWEKFTTVFAPKVRGSWILHCLTQALPLDFFVLFSSSASLLGPVGMANYAAANAFLDGLAFYRRSLGLPALTIDWGPWENVGMAAAVGDQRERQWASAGFGTMSASQGLEILGRLLHQTEPQVAVLPRVNWIQYLDQNELTERSKFFSFLAAASKITLERQVAEPPGSRLRQQLTTALPAEQREILQRFIRTQLVEVLGFGQTHHIEPHWGFFELGLDSLTAIELKNRLQHALEGTLPATVIFDYPTLDHLTDYLYTEIIDSQPQTVFDLEPNGPTEDDLSEDELITLLTQTLDKLDEQGL